MDIKLQEGTFWTDEYVRSLPVNGKFALLYATMKQIDEEPIVLEDMAQFTGMTLAVCEAWLAIFHRLNKIPSTVLGNVL